MITHILFDFFGTLVEYSDSRTEQGYKGSHSALLSYGASLGYIEFLERWSKTFHNFDLESEATQDEYSMDDVVSGFLTEVFGPDFPPDLVPVFRDTYLQEWNKGVNYIEGVPDMLRQLSQRYTLALVTNTHHSELVLSHLRAMQIIDYFSAIITSVEHGKRKPYASIFQFALQATGGTSHQALYVGDSFTSDYLGANGIGMRCVLIDPQKKQNLPSEDHITHILDLWRILDIGKL